MNASRSDSKEVPFFQMCIRDSTRTVTEVDDAGNEVEVEETYTVAVPIRDLSVVYENIRSKMGTEITAEDQANATEIYYRILCGGPAPTYGSEFDIWSDGLPLSDAPFIGADGFCSPIGESWRSVVTSEFGDVYKRQGRNR